MIRGDPVALPSENDSLAKLGYVSVSVLPFILHLGFMAATAFFVMHVQVRLIHLVT
jgi:phosphatidylinositol glycan class V